MISPSTRRHWALAIGALWVCVPQIALACPVCFSAQNEENRAAFVAMTAFLTLLPLGMLGLGLGWVWRRVQRAENPVPMASDEREPSAPATSTTR